MHRAGAREWQQRWAIEREGRTIREREGSWLGPLSALFMHTMLFESAAVIAERQFDVSFFASFFICSFVFVGLCSYCTFISCVFFLFGWSLPWPRTILLNFIEQSHWSFVPDSSFVRLFGAALKFAFNSTAAGYKFCEGGRFIEPITHGDCLMLSTSARRSGGVLLLANLRQ